MAGLCLKGHFALASLPVSGKVRVLHCSSSSTPSLIYTTAAKAVPKLETRKSERTSDKGKQIQVSVKPNTESKQNRAPEKAGRGKKSQKNVGMIGLEQPVLAMGPYTLVMDTVSAEENIVMDKVDIKGKQIRVSVKPNTERKQSRAPEKAGRGKKSQKNVGMIGLEQPLLTMGPYTLVMDTVSAEENTVMDTVSAEGNAEMGIEGLEDADDAEDDADDTEDSDGEESNMDSDEAEELDEFDEPTDMFVPPGAVMSEEKPLRRLPGSNIYLGPYAGSSRVKEAEFVKSSPCVAECPPVKLPEFAMVGRSNVGKSSLINSLVQRKDLAQTSKKPGKTQLINHFIINKSWYLVDLPGYGYAKVPASIRASWDGFTKEFFLQSKSLVCVMLLVDGSIPPQQIDLEYAAWLRKNKVPLTIVFTKCDRKKKKKNGGRKPEENVKDFLMSLKEQFDLLPPWITTSCVTNQGKDGLLMHMSQLRNYWSS